MHNPEFRLKSSSRQDRSVKTWLHARTTDKGSPRGWIYSLILRNNLKKETQANIYGQGQVDSSTTTLTLSAMASRMSACRVGSDRPSVITTDSTNWDRYHNLLQPQQRFQDAQSAKGGFSSLMFQGIPVLDDAQCPSSHMFFINEDYLKFYVHKDADFKFEPFAKPVNQDVKVAKLLLMCSLASSNNRMHGKLSALAA